MISKEWLNKAMFSFDEIEKRGSFYHMAVNLIHEGFEIEAYLLILVTWNFGVFRYMVKDFDLDRFKEKIKELAPYFDKIKNESFKTIDFDKYKNDIEKIFQGLSRIKGVQYTGASKVMHLKNRNVFVMWDNYIRGGKPKKYYEQLQIVQDGCWRFKRWEKSAEGYFQFLKAMQNIFKDTDFRHPKKTFAKAIDEFNYVEITLPIKEMEKAKRKKRGKK